MTVRKTLVIGGGIGGPVAAMALQRAGIRATVHEATEAPVDYAGLFLNTSSNGLDVLRTLDIDVTRQADGFPMPRMVGQGASLAMEDGLVVAKCLRDLPDPEQALATYERLRRDRAEKVVAYSRRIGQSKAISNPIGIRIRDLVMPFALRRLANSQAHAWVYTYRVDWEEKAA